MRSNKAVFPSTLLSLLAHQNLVTATPTTIFFTLTSRKMKARKPTSGKDCISTRTMTDDSNIFTFHNEELLTDRTRFILEDPTLRDVLFPDVPQREAKDLFWHDFVRSVDNMDEINSVKNRSGEQHHTTLNININTGYRIDFNITTFCLSSSLVHQHGPTDMAPLLTVMPSMTHKIIFVVVAYNIHKESRTTSLPSIRERPLHQDPLYAAEKTSPPASIPHILPLRVDTTTPIDATAHQVYSRFASSVLDYTFEMNYSHGLFTSADILTCNMHYCQLGDVYVFHNDGG